MQRILKQIQQNMKPWGKFKKQMHICFSEVSVVVRHHQSDANFLIILSCLAETIFALNTVLINGSTA